MLQFTGKGFQLTCMKLHIWGIICVAVLYFSPLLFYSTTCLLNWRQLLLFLDLEKFIYLSKYVYILLCISTYIYSSIVPSKRYIATLSQEKNIKEYSPRSELFVSEMDVSSTKIRLDTSISATSNS